MTESVEQDLNEEQTNTEIEKEGAAKEYSREYFEELRAAAKEYLPKTVWDHIHSKARNKAGGRASGKSKRETAASSAASTSATSAGAVTQPPEVEAQLEQARQLTQKADSKEVEKQEMHPDCQKVAQNCQKMKTNKADESKPEVDKTAHGKQDAPIASTGGWDAPAAVKRLLAWAGGPDKENVSWSKFARGFLYHDPNNADNIGGYKYPVADIINGKFQISRAALTAAAGRINQSSGIPPDELASMKSTLRSYYKEVGEEAPDNIAKTVDTFVGPNARILFVAASPGTIENIRKSALVGPTGRIFNERYLKPLKLTRDDVAIAYLVPRLLKDDVGKPREPTPAEVSSWHDWFDSERARVSARTTVALGHTVKNSLGKDIDVTLPHPNSLGTKRTDEELIRKRLQLERMISNRR